MRACLDGGERRLLLASSLGEILVFRFVGERTHRFRCHQFRRFPSAEHQRPQSLATAKTNNYDSFSDGRFLQGARIRTLSPGHAGPVSGMVYIKEDKVHRTLHVAHQTAPSVVAVHRRTI